MPKHQQIIGTVSLEMDGQRLDQVVASLCPQYSRSQLQKWIKAGNVRVDDKICKPKERLTGGEEIVINVILEPQTEFDAEDIPLNIVYEDDAIIIVNKPVGLVVHPAAGNWSVNPGQCVVALQPATGNVAPCRYCSPAG